MSMLQTGSGIAGIFGGIILIGASFIPPHINPIPVGNSTLQLIGGTIAVCVGAGFVALDSDEGEKKPSTKKTSPARK